MMRSLPWLTLGLLLPSSAAFAHGFLERADPAVGSEVASPPRRLTLKFTEGAEPLFSTVEVHDAQGTLVTTGKTHTAPSDNRELKSIGLPCTADAAR